MKAISFLLAAVSLASLCLGFAASVFVYPSGIWAFLAFVCFVAFCTALLRAKPAAFLMLSPLLFLRATEMFAGVAIESGSFIRELSVYGSPTGAFARLAALYILFFSIASYIIDMSWAKNRLAMSEIPDRIASFRGGWLILAALAGLIMYILSIGYREGYPLIEGIDRFEFRRDLGDRIFSVFMNNRYTLSLLLGFLMLSPVWRKASVAVAFLLFLTSILYAEKFTSLSLILIVTLIPTGLVRLSRGQTISFKMVAGVILVIMAVTIPIVLSVYGLMENPLQAFQALLNRMTAQGELWWSADRNNLEFFRLDANPILADIATWMDLSSQKATVVGNKFGAYYVMELYAPREVAYFYESVGIAYVFPLFAYLLITTGVFGVITIGILLHVIYALVVCWIIRAIAEMSIVRMIFSMQLFVFTVSGGFIGGYLWNFFGLRFWAFCLPILFLQRFRITLSSADSEQMASLSKRPA